MDIRLAKINELDSILKIYDEAIAFMRAHGNDKQWVNGYPSRELLTQDIKDKHLYVVTTEKEIVAVFSYVIGIDSTYIEIDGKEASVFRNKMLNHQHRLIEQMLQSTARVTALSIQCLERVLS